MEKMKSKGFFNGIKKYKETKLRMIGKPSWASSYSQSSLNEDGGIKGVGVINGHTEKLKDANIEFSNNGIGCNGVILERLKSFIIPS